MSELHVEVERQIGAQAEQVYRCIADCRASVSTTGTETGFELGSGNASISANGQVIAFESEGALVPTDTGFPVDIYVHDEGV